MSLKTLVNSIAVAAITAGTLLAGPSGAQARDWGGGHGRGGVERGEGRWSGHHGRGAWAHDGGRRHHRDHTGRNIAIGAFAAILGLALAAESARVQRDYYDERD